MMPASHVSTKKRRFTAKKNPVWPIWSNNTVQKWSERANIIYYDSLEVENPIFGDFDFFRILSWPSQPLEVGCCPKIGAFFMFFCPKNHRKWLTMPRWKYRVWVVPMVYQASHGSQWSLRVKKWDSREFGKFSMIFVIFRGRKLRRCPYVNPTSHVITNKRIFFGVFDI